MWKLYKRNKDYIQGELVSTHSTESAALKKAKKIIDFNFSEREKRKSEIIIWLDGANHFPVGMITKKIKGVKKTRRNKKKE